jgi:WD40 repeat protein
MDTATAGESFRSLFLRHRGRTGLTQRDLAAHAGAGLRSVHIWEAGAAFPSAERLKALIRLFLATGGLTSGQETVEARALWAAAERDAPRMHASFDGQWFAQLLTAHGLLPRASNTTEPKTETRGRAQDWGEAPDTEGFVGRSDELAQLSGWVLDRRCRIVTLLGFGGIGKTMLAAALAQHVAPHFERVYWRSLRNAPPVVDWLAGAIGFLSDHEVVPPPSESERINALLQLLRGRRCLLVLDNSETLFEAGQRESRYRAAMEGYGRFLQAVGEASHQSCLVLTSREEPPELPLLGAAVRTMVLHGLGPTEAQALLVDKQLTGGAQAWIGLVDRYDGNGLALKIVGETIRQVYDGDIAIFVADVIASYGTVFGGIRRLLDVQVERLSPTERDVLRRLAVEREPASLAELAKDLPPGATRKTVVEAIEILRRRSLVERGESGTTFTLQSMVLEYMTDRVVDTVAGEIDRGEAVVLIELPLIKAQAKDYVRETQERLIGAPILERVAVQHPGAGTQPLLQSLLDGWRGRPEAEQGYGPGNVVNLLRLLRGDLRAMDLSRLALRHVYLQGIDARDATLAGTRLMGAVLDEAFPYPVSVALSEDAAFLVAGTPTGDVRVWRVADRTLLLVVPGHTGMVMGVAISSDGRLVASAGFDGTVRVWQTSSGQLLATLQGHTSMVYGVTVSGDGTVLASAGADGTVRLWQAATGQLLATLLGHIGVVWCVALSRDGRLLASGAEDGTVRVWDVQNRQLLRTLRGHTGAVQGVALSADGRLLASASFDGTVRLWALPEGHALRTLQGHAGVIYAVALSGDGRLVASGGVDGALRLWDSASGESLASLQAHNGLVMGVAVSADGRLAVTGSADGMLRLWEVESRQPVASLLGHTGVDMCVALSPDGQLLANGGLDGLVCLWETGSGKLVATLKGHRGLVRSVAVSGDGRLVASASWDGTLRLWTAPSGDLRTILEGHTGLVMGVALSAEGWLVASGGADGFIRLWDARSGQSVATLPGHMGLVMSVALSGNGRVVASGGRDGMVRLWKTDSGELSAALKAHSGSVWGVALSADGRMAASGGADGMVRLWDGETGHLLAELQGHIGVVYGVALSADGNMLASGGVDGTVRLWSTATGQLLAGLQDHMGVIWGVALSMDGRLLASGGDDGMVRLWDTASRASPRTMRSDRRYQRLDITGLTGVTQAERAALLALGAIDHAPAPAGWTSAAAQIAAQ